MVKFYDTTFELDRVLSSTDKLVAVDFTASWCGPCQQIGPRFEALATGGAFPHVDFAKVDVDKNQEAATQFMVRGMPTFMFFRHGAKLAEVQGADEARLVAALRQHGGPPVTIAPGSAVFVCCVRSKPEANGQRGLVAAYDVVKGRYAVALASGGKQLALKRANVVCALDDVPLHPSADAPTPDAAGGAAVVSLCGLEQAAGDEADDALPVYRARAGGGEEFTLPLACVRLPVGARGVVVGLTGAPEQCAEPESNRSPPLPALQFLADSWYPLARHVRPSPLPRSPLAHAAIRVAQQRQERPRGEHRRGGRPLRRRGRQRAHAAAQASKLPRVGPSEE